MNFENFKLVVTKDQQIIEIDYLGEIMDLHNASEFLRIEYIVKKCLLNLFWNYYSDDSIIPFQIKFENVNYFEISPRDNEIPKDEDDCLEEIIYNEKIEFKFMGGVRIIVGAEKVFFEK